MVIVNQVLQSFHLTVIRKYKLNHISENIHLFYNYFNAVVTKMKDNFVNSILPLFCAFTEKFDIYGKLSCKAE